MPINGCLYYACLSTHYHLSFRWLERNVNKIEISCCRWIWCLLQKYVHSLLLLLCSYVTIFYRYMCVKECRDPSPLPTDQKYSNVLTNYIPIHSFHLWSVGWFTQSCCYISVITRIMSLVHFVIRLSLSASSVLTLHVGLRVCGEEQKESTI